MASSDSEDEEQSSARGDSLKELQAGKAVLPSNLERQLSEALEDEEAKVIPPPQCKKGD